MRNNGQQQQQLLAAQIYQESPTAGPSGASQRRSAPAPPPQHHIVDEQAWGAAPPPAGQVAANVPRKKEAGCCDNMGSRAQELLEKVPPCTCKSSGNFSPCALKVRRAGGEELPESARGGDQGRGEPVEGD